MSKRSKSEDGGARFIAAQRTARDSASMEVGLWDVIDTQERGPGRVMACCAYHEQNARDIAQALNHWRASGAGQAPGNDEMSQYTSNGFTVRISREGIAWAVMAWPNEGGVFALRLIGGLGTRELAEQCARGFLEHAASVDLAQW